MSSALRAASKRSSSAAVQLFEMLTDVFNDHVPQDGQLLDIAHSKLLRDKVSRLMRAPREEREAVKELLREVSDALETRGSAGENHLGTDSDAEVDASLDRALHAANVAAQRPMSTAHSVLEGNALMRQAHKVAETERTALIEAGELIASPELQKRLGITRQSLSEAVQAGRMFFINGPKGRNYYPAFYVDPSYDRRMIERTSQQLGTLPGAAKYRFFTSASFALEGLTPLQALEQGRLNDVLGVASAYADR